jgi:CRISPR-associated exonuclease Cas4
MAALILRGSARKQRIGVGLNEAPIYSDTGRSREILISEKHRLIGKPDHIVKTDGTLVPIERKSRNVTGWGPHEGEILQLVAYLVIVEEHFRVSVTTGRLQYANRTIDVPFDDDLRTRLASALASIRRAEMLPDVVRSHNYAARCRGCGHRSVCDQALG